MLPCLLGVVALLGSKHFGLCSARDRSFKGCQLLLLPTQNQQLVNCHKHGVRRRIHIRFRDLLHSRNQRRRESFHATLNIVSRTTPTTILPRQCKDRFIKANLDFSQEPQLENVVFVDELKIAYSDEDVPILGNNTATPATSPLIGKDAVGCFSILSDLSLVEGSSINPEPFAILDERSMQDDTALLCEAGEEGVSSVRATFGVTVCRLRQYFAADAGTEQDRELAACESDGVLRIG